jgi:hypothetical protein
MNFKRVLLFKLSYQNTHKIYMFVMMLFGDWLADNIGLHLRRFHLKTETESNLRNVVFLNKDKTKDNNQNWDSCFEYLINKRTIFFFFFFIFIFFFFWCFFFFFFLLFEYRTRFWDFFLLNILLNQLWKDHLRTHNFLFRSVHESQSQISLSLSRFISFARQKGNYNSTY